MRKVFILMLSMMVLWAANAKENCQEPKTPPKKVYLSPSSDGQKITRTLVDERIQAYYFLGNLQFFALPSLGDVDIKVENLLTNEVFCGEFNSLEDQQYVLYLGEEAGNYEITCTTSSGEVYVGTLCI